jgi:hypothetical protein
MTFTSLWLHEPVIAESVFLISQNGINSRLPQWFEPETSFFREKPGVAQIQGQSERATVRRQHEPV